MTPMKMITNAVTGAAELVLMTEADLAEQARIQSITREIEALEIKEQERLETIKAEALTAIATLPGVDEICNAKDFAELRALTLKLQAAVIGLARHAGLVS